MDFANPLTTLPEPAMELAPTLPGASVGIVGGGLGGLACAARLARKGLSVTLYERNTTLGGKLARQRWEGYTWDTGPSLLTMPHILEDLWRDLGAELADDLELVRLPSSCRYFWDGGTILEQDEAFWRQPDLAAFLEHARGIYELSADTYLQYPPDEWLGAISPKLLGDLRHLPKMASGKTLSELAHKYTSDPRLIQILERYATFNGSSPYETPAAFAIIPWVEAEFGGWWVRGGLYRIAEALAKRAEVLGVRMRTGTRVLEIQQTGGGPQTCLELTLQEGEQPPHSARHQYVVCNQDVLSAHEEILASHLREGLPDADPPAHPLSLAAFVILLAVERQYAELQHHNIFFSNNYREEFADLFERRQFPGEPTIYVTVSARTEPNRAPEGCENWFVLVNAPNLEGCENPLDWRRDGAAYADRVIHRLEHGFGLKGLARAVAYRELITPADFRDRTGAFGGGLYGFASHGRLSAFQRPPMVAPACDRLLFTGGSTHPGGGIPLVLLSGQMAARKILKREKLP